MTREHSTLEENPVLEQHLLLRNSLLQVPVLLIERTLEKLLQYPANFDSKISLFAKEEARSSTGVFYTIPFISQNSSGSLTALIQADESFAASGHHADVLGKTLEQAETSEEVTEPDITYVL